ncbi:hypothetical protein [Paenibacillus sp. y28]|uniref:hypothetical protein n=1 Tax=Paenibacillus sp. y28 TaxID=3129110 RepID=UPI0030192C4E
MESVEIGLEAVANPAGDFLQGITAVRLKNTSNQRAQQVGAGWFFYVFLMKNRSGLDPNKQRKIYIRRNAMASDPYNGTLYESQ